MKKLIALIILFSLFANTVQAGVLNDKMGIQPPLAQFGTMTSLSGTTFAVDTNWNFLTAGSKAALYKFQAPVQQVNGNLTCYVYMTAKTGSPTNTEMVLYPGPLPGTDDPQRPNSQAVATSTNVNVSLLTLPAWVTYSFTNVTLATSTYFSAITNTTATPASNNFTLMTRPQNFLITGRLVGDTTIDGLNTDPVIVSSTEPPMVCKFNDGTLMGNPYVVSTTLGSNTQYRGMRFQFDADIEFLGLISNLTTVANGSNWYVYQGSTLITSMAADKFQTNNQSMIYFPSPVTFTHGLPYDVVFVPNGNSTIGAHVGPGTSPPADVAAATYSQMGFVIGATPGSFTYSPGEFTGMVLVPNNIPATSGGTATDILGNVIQ